MIRVRKRQNIVDRDCRIVVSVYLSLEDVCNVWNSDLIFESAIPLTCMWVARHRVYP